MAVTKLKIENTDPFYIWGILCSQGGHKLCWEMNKTLKTQLQRDKDIEVVRRPTAEDLFFNFYSHFDEVSYLSTELIKNKSNGDFYMRELRNFDYVLTIKGEVDFFDPKDFTRRLKQIECIQAAIIIDMHKIKNQEDLIII